MKDSEKAGLEIMLWDCIQEVFSSNLGQNIICGD
jgi:hypothetical protein